MAASRGWAHVAPAQSGTAPHVVGLHPRGGLRAGRRLPFGAGGVEAHADFSNGARQVIGELVMFNGAAVAASTTTLKAKALSTMEGELGGTSRVLTRTEYGRNIARALGVPQEGATFIGTDNLAHLLVATHKGSASRARHLLVRYIQTKQAIARGECVLGHVPDAQMPADHLTKWVTKEKLEASIATIRERHDG